MAVRKRLLVILLRRPLKRKEFPPFSPFHFCVTHTALSRKVSAPPPPIFFVPFLRPHFRHFYLISRPLPAPSSSFAKNLFLRNPRFREYLPRTQRDFLRVTWQQKKEEKGREEEGCELGPTINGGITCWLWRRRRRRIKEYFFFFFFL